MTAGAPRGGAGGGASGFGGFGNTAPAAGNVSIRTGGPGAAIGVTVTPRRASDQPITWSTKSDLVSLSSHDRPQPRRDGPQHHRPGRNGWPSPRPRANGFYVTAYVHVEPKFIDPPAVTAGPTLNPPAGGQATVDYTLALGGKQDQSLVTWYLCDDAAGANPRNIAVSRGDELLKALTLTPGYVGKYLKVTIQPKHPISEAGPAVPVVSQAPVQAADVTSTTVSPNFRNFVPDANATIVNGLWTVLGYWNITTGDTYVNGYGIRPAAAARARPGAAVVPMGPAALLYQQDADTGDMQVDVTMAPEKTEGTGFSVPGSPADNGPRNLHADILIKYDPRTKTGYALRYWRTIESAGTCMYQFYKIENGAGSPLGSRQVLSGVFKPNTHLVVKVTGTAITAHATNDADHATLDLADTIVPNRFGGGGVNWPRGSSSNVYSRIEISYPGAAAAQ